MGIRKIGSDEQIVLDQPAPQTSQSSLRKLAPGEEITLDADRAVLNPRATTPVYYPKQEADTSIVGHLKEGGTDVVRLLTGYGANIADMAADKADALQYQGQRIFYDIFGQPKSDEIVLDEISVPEGNVVSRNLREGAAQASGVERNLAGIIDSYNVQDTVNFDEVKADPISMKTGRFILEQGARSAPYLGLALVPKAGAPLVYSAVSQNILEERNANQGRDGTAVPTGIDLQTATAFAVPSALLERAGALGDIGKFPNLFKSGGVEVAKDFGGATTKPTLASRGLTTTGRIAKSGAGEAGTEAIQENLELSGATAGTDVEPTLEERIDVGVQGALIGGPMGASVRTGVEGINAVTDKSGDYKQKIDQGFTQQGLGTDAQQQAPAAQVEVPANRDALADAIKNNTPLPETKTVDLPDTQIDPALQEQGLVIGADVEQITETGEVINGAVAAAQEIDGELEVTVLDKDGQLRTLFASEGEIQINSAPAQTAPQQPEVQEQAQPEPQPQPEPPRAPPPEPTNAYADMDMDQLTSVLTGIKTQAKQSGWNRMLTENSRKVRAELDSRFPEWDIPAKVDVADAAQDVNTDPTEAQKEAGNYKKGHVSIQGLPITLENTKGSERSGTDQNGEKWSVEMPAHYGYIKRTEGADSEQIDVYVGDTPSSPSVFVVDQVDAETKNFDEHKAFIGFDNTDQVKVAYSNAFNDGRANERYGGMTEMTMPEFKDWLKNGNNRKPIQYKKPNKQEFVPTGHNLAVDLMGGFYETLPNEKKGDLIMIAVRYNRSLKQGTPDPVAARVIEAISIGQEVRKYKGQTLSEGMFKDAMSMAKRYGNAIHENMSSPVQSAKIKADEKRLAKKIDKAHDFLDEQDVANNSVTNSDAQNVQPENENDTDNATEDSVAEPENQAQQDSVEESDEQKDTPSEEVTQEAEPDSIQSEGEMEAQEAETPSPEVTDQQIEDAIRKAKPWTYLDELKKDVAQQLGLPEDYDFGTRVYSINQILRGKLIEEDGWLAATEDVLKQYEGQKVEVLRGVGGISGQRVETATIKSNGRGGYLALPPRARTKGYLPNYIRPIEVKKSATEKSKPKKKKSDTDIKITEKDDDTGSKETTLFGVKINFDFGEDGKVNVFDFVSKNKREGNARKALKKLKEVYGGVLVLNAYSEPNSTEEPLLFWQKMLDEGLVESVETEEGQFLKKSPKAPKKSDKTVKDNQNQDKIEDFGEKLEGARKHTWESYNHSLTKALPEDISKITMSKHFPEPKYDELIEGGMDVERLAAFKALRDQVGNKPRSPYKLRRWADEVRQMRSLAQSVIGDNKAFEAFKSEGEKVRQLNGFFERIELYKELGYPAFTKAKDWNIRKSHGVIENGVKLDRPVWFVAEKSSWGTRFDSYEEAVKALKTILSDTSKTKRKTKLDIYRVTATGEIIIGKKVASGKYIDLKGGFEKSRDASAYLNENYDDLIAQLEKKKNVAPVRRSTNDPRIGDDYRSGKDVTPEQFGDAFGFRGVQFGNYVEQKKRQSDLNNAFDGLMDMAKIIGVPEKALSLNGTLGLAFGARGKGAATSVPAKAHYESDQIVINLTKRDGAGSLGHEWFHALDNYFGTMNEGGFITERPTERRFDKNQQPRDVLPVRQEVIDAYKNLMKVIRKDTKIIERSKELDKLRSKDYWSTGREVTARSFESYLIRKAEENGGRNDYLANISSQEAYEYIMGEGTYPYPIESEMDAIVAAYDNLFETINTKQTDKGIALFRRSGQTKDLDQKLSQEIEGKINDRLKKLGWPQANFRLYNSVDELPSLTGLDDRVQGFYWKKMIYVSMNSSDILTTIDHEAIHALKDFGAFTPAEWDALERQAPKWRKKYKIDKQYKSLMKAQGVRTNIGLERRLNEEAIAHAFQDRNNKGLIRRIANKAVKFVKAIREVLTGNPYQFSDAEAVFRAVETGQIGARLQDNAVPDDFPKYQLSKAKKPALEQATKSLAEVRGLERSLNDDLRRISSLILHPQQIATLYKEFTPVYRAVIERFKTREVLVHQLSKNIDLYNRLDEASKKKVNAALEIGRLTGETYKVQNDGTITVKNEGLQNTVHSEDGETISLTSSEAAAYLGVRKTMDMALDKYMETILEEYGLLEQGVKTIQDVEKLRLKSAKDGNKAEVRRFKEILQRLNDVMDAKKRGYIPFKRWGEIGVSVKDADGEMVHFEKIELPEGVRKLLRRQAGKRHIGEQKEVRQVLDRLAEKYNDANYDINFFEMNKFDEVAANIDLRSLDVLASSSEMSEKDYHALREMLEKEMQKRGFRSHFFRSKDVPGYSADFERAINDYVVSISSYISRRLHERGIDDKVSSIAEAGKPELFEYAQQYQEYSSNPQEEIATIRMMGFFWYLAGNISSGLVNLTQPFLVTAPYYSAKFSHAQIAKQMAKAYTDAAKIVDPSQEHFDFYDFEKAPADVRDALIKAYQEGDFLSMATYDAMAISNSNTQALRGLEKKKRWAQEAIALTFSIPEKTNRVVTFISAYRLAMQPGAEKKIMRFVKNDEFAKSMLEGKTGKDFAFAYAELAVVSTQYRVGKLNRPKITRSYGSLIFQFWSFMMQTFELMYKLNKVHGGNSKAALGVMLLAIVSVAGYKGLPFEDDIEDIIEALYKFRTGKDLDIDTKMRELLIKHTGSKFIAESIMQGLPSSMLNLDMSGRLGFGNVAPDRGTDALGVWWDMLYERPVRAAEYANKGDVVRAVAEVSPAFLRNPMTALTWNNDGIRTQKGAKVLDAEDVSDWDVGLKFLGFTSSNVSRKRDEIWAASRLNTAADDLRGRYYSRIAKALAERTRRFEAGDTAGAEEMALQIKTIMEEINRHNQTHPLHERIFPNEYTIKQRYREEMSGADARKTRKQARPRREELREIYSWPK